MNPYKIQNRSDISRRIKLVKNGGTIGFAVEPTATFIENMRDAGFCLLPIVPLPPMNNALSSINLSSFPMGTDGRISLYQNAELVYSVRYQNLDTMQSRFDFFESEFSDYAHLEFEGDDTYIFAVTGEPGQIRFVFEDDDIDYVFNNFEQMESTSNPTLIVEQYRLSFDLKEVSMISCAGAINSAPVYVVGAEFTLRVWLNDVLIIDNPGPNSFVTQVELWNRGILIDPDRETIVNQTTDNVRLTFQTGSWSDEDVRYVTGLAVNNMDNPTVKLKVPTEDQTGQVEIPQLTETYYSEVSFCLAPRATFTCDGATNVLNMAIDSIIEPSNCIIAIQYEIDGVIYHALHSTAHDDDELIAPQLDQSVLNKLTNISDLFTYTPFQYGMSLTNNSTTQYRVNNLIVLGWSSLVANSGNPYRNNVEPMRFQFYGNPSARAADGDTSEGFSVNFCISGESVISCEDATDSIYFPSLGGYWHVELDGVLYENNGYDYIAPFIRHNFSDILDASDDGWARITNIDTTNHRIKLIPLNDPDEPNGYTAPTIQAAIYHQSGSTDYFPSLNAVCENSNYEAWDQAIPEPETGYVGSCRPIGGTGGYTVYKDIGTTPHPTFMGHDDGSLTFCLAPLEVSVDLYTPAVLALNPKAYYPMNEESGNVVTDLSPSGFDGEIRQTEHITYRQEVIRKGSAGALGFNTDTNGSAGTAECFVSDTTAGDFFRKLAGNGKSCTIAFWCKPISVKQYTYLAAYILNSAMGYNNYRFIAYNGDKLLAQSPNNDNQVASTNSFTEMINQSNFIVWRKDAVAQTYTLTVNGVSKTVSGEASPEATGQGFYFPMSDGYSSYGLRGYMSDMSVFDYALSDVQIANLYAKGKLA